MASDSIEDLIKSAQNKKESYYLRNGWVILAKSKINKAQGQLDQLDKDIHKIKHRSKK